MTGREGDFLRTISHIEDDMQLYWQSFPAAGGKDRTTYMFTYADADRRRPSLEVPHGLGYIIELWGVR